MGDIIFNKLVRDKIPEIIRENGSNISIRLLEDDEYYIELNKKLKEEVNEYLSDNSIEELADIVEVIKAILELKNISSEEFEKIRLNKQKERGAFKLKIFLESVQE